MGRHIPPSYYHNNNNNSMKFLIASCLLVLAVAQVDLANGQLEVEVTGENVDRSALDRFFCCPQTQALCARQCAGQDCSKTCTGRCGIFGFRTCGPFSCSAIAASTCTTTTTTTTTTPTAPTTPTTPPSGGGSD